MPLLNVPHHLQETDSSCLPACVRMVLTFLNVEQTESELRRLLRTRVYGTSVLNVRWLETLGLEVQLLSGTLDEIRSAIANGQPVVVFLWTGELSHWQSEDSVDYLHAVVVIGFDEAHLLVNDPAYTTHPVSILRQEFLETWSYSRQTMILLEKRLD